MLSSRNNEFKKSDEANRWVGLYKNSHPMHLKIKRWAIFQNYAQKRAARRLELCTGLIETYKDLNVLDLACGGGHYGKVILKRSGNWVGMDLSYNMLVLSKSFLGGKGMPVKLVNGDITRLPFCKESFHIIFCIGILSYFTSRKTNKIIEQLSDLLRPGGKLILQTIRWDILTWLRSRLPYWIPRPIRLPGPLYPQKAHMIIDAFKNSTIKLTRKFEVKKLYILPHQTIYVFVKKDTGSKI